MARLELEGVSKSFGNTVAVNTLSIGVNDGELLCLLGSSGSGKSTLLRMIGGFELTSSGRILIDGEDVAAKPPEHRPTAMVFQSHALWTHMTVSENVAFGLRLRGLPRAEVATKVTEALEMVGLAGYGDRRTPNLSGGQQQRVAIARCLVLRPKILLMDEPFASLDQHLRERLRDEVRAIQQKLAITTIFVTHAQDEALALADRIAVMSMGKLEQIGTPDEIYARPATAFVAGFIGTMNLIELTVSSGATSLGGLQLATPVADGPITLALRPEDWQIDPAQGFALTVTRVINLGAHALVEADLADGTRVKIHLPKASGVKVGDSLRLAPGPFALYRDNAAIYRSEGGMV